MSTNPQLTKARVALLQGKTWRYLRYQHAREALKLAPSYANVLVVGAGHGLAEVALAIEFPTMRFTLTDHPGATHNTAKAKASVAAFGLTNISFAGLDILAPDTDERFDVVYSVEVLEHIEDAALAAANMAKLSRDQVFVLVPFAEKAQNNDAGRRARALEVHEHHVVGYDAQDLVNLFPSPIAIRGCYWKDAGFVFRERVTALTPAEIEAQVEDLVIAARTDIRPVLPALMSQAQGIWILSACGTARAEPRQTSTAAVDTPVPVPAPAPPAAPAPVATPTAPKAAKSAKAAKSVKRAAAPRTRSRK